jgi:hypothetical protein
MINVMIPVAIGDIGPVKIIVLVDVDIDIAMSPPPVAIPPQSRANDYSSSKSENRASGHISWWVVVIRWIRGVPPRTIHPVGL